MIRKILLLLFAILLTSCQAGTPTPHPTPSGGQMDDEEQLVYAAVLNQLYAASMYVIMAATATEPGGRTDPASSLERVQQEMRLVDPATTESFRLRNDAPHPIHSNMALGASYVLLNQADMALIFAPNRDGWQSFYTQYPEAPGIISLSRAGFNDQLDQALVYVGVMSHYLAGAGYLILLNKVDGVWKIDQQVMTWIS